MPQKASDKNPDQAGDLRVGLGCGTISLCGALSLCYSIKVSYIVILGITYASGKISYHALRKAWKQRKTKNISSSK